MQTFGKLFLFFSSSILVVSSLVGCEQGGHQQPVTSVTYMVAKKENIDLSAELQGRVSAYFVSEVRPQVGGIIQSRLFTEGAIVQEGDTLYQIDPALYKASYDNAKAAVLRAEAAEKSARLLAQRYTELVKSKAVSRQEYDDAVANANTAKADVVAAKAALETARINLDYTQVKAPVSGRIGISSVTPGALVTANQATALATIQQMGRMYVDVNQSSFDLMKMRQRLGNAVNDKVILKFQDDSVYKNAAGEPVYGTLQFYDVSVNPDTDMVQVRVLFPNEEGMLLPGMFARTVIPQGTDPNGFLVPQNIPARDIKGDYVVKVLVAGNATQKDPSLFEVEQRVVKLSGVKGNNWYVSAGLNDADKVVVEGWNKIQAKQVVKGTLVIPGSLAKSGGATQPAANATQQ